MMPSSGLFLTALLVTTVVAQAELNSRPIIGVLLQEAEDGAPGQYVPASYVKWVEMAGARVVPIFIKRPKEYYVNLLSQLNGVLMPGGDTALLNTGYSEAADLIFKMAMAKYKAEKLYRPIWATCMSFEKLITFFTGNSESWQTNCQVEDVSLGLQFEANISTNGSVKMLNRAEHIFKILQNYNVTANYHQICLTVETFKKNPNLAEQFTLVSTNTYGGVHFVSTLEHKRYPIYATQWHPEKNQFEWVLKKNFGAINHDFNAIQVGQYFGNFFVNEARKNRQQFTNTTEEAEALIYNYSQQLLYSGKTGNGYIEIYLWPL